MVSTNSVSPLYPKQWKAIVSVLKNAFVIYMEIRKQTGETVSFKLNL